MDDRTTGGEPRGRVDTVDLASCDREPIHIPGAIQPHGALLAFGDDLVVEQASANAAEFLGHGPHELIGKPLDPALLSATAYKRLADAVAVGVPERANPLAVGPGGGYGLVHRAPGGPLVLEVEPADDAAAPAASPENAFLRLQSCTSLAQLLEAAAAEVTDLLGFDRVMIYRFLPDASGEVVAEERAESLEPFLGLRYPASDIPSQARRLYALNPIRMIADARYVPVPLENGGTGRVLDLSMAVLRSVSPIHLEYLANMDVAASLSISLLVSGRLWGLIACHHRQPRRVGPAARSAAQLMSRTVSLLIGQLEQHERAAVSAASAGTRRALISRVEDSGDVVQSLAIGEPSVLEYLEVGGAAVSFQGQVATLGRAPPRSFIADLVTWLPVRGDLFVTDELAAHYPAAADHAGDAAGLLALGFDPRHDGYVLFFRPEQQRTVRWAGNPNKPVVPGPRGARLNPRASFAEWKETVRGRSAPWRDGELDAARALQYELTALSLKWSAERDRLRDLFVGILGHDLRSPLAAITMAAQLLGIDSSSNDPVELGARIARSSKRMSRMVSQLLDFSRIQSGSGIAVNPEELDLADLVGEIVDEQRMASPGCAYQLEIRHRDRVTADPDRLQQVVANLLSNARQHGEPKAPITIAVDRTADGERALISVHNWGEPIPEALRGALFAAYKGSGQGRSKGLGLGLYIAHSIVVAHGGSIELTSSAESGTTFRILLPRLG